MTLKQWVANGWLKPHKTSAEETGNLLAIARRDMQDARKADISDDWRFGIAYNAALKFCTILLYAKGYRPDKNLAHYRTIQALPLILGENRKDDAEYLDACRAKRNTVEYDYVGGVTGSEADELLAFTQGLGKDVLAWLKAQHPELLK